MNKQGRTKRLVHVTVKLRQSKARRYTLHELRVGVGAIGNTAFNGGHTESIVSKAQVEISTENEAMGTWEMAQWVKAFVFQA